MNHNTLVLAYIGDAIYELYIRNYLIEKKIEKVNDLQKAAIPYVSAKGQDKYVKEMVEKEFLTEDEKAIVWRGRNYKGTRHPKNTDLITYKYATGLEALIGYLYLENKKERVDEIMHFILGK